MLIRRRFPDSAALHAEILAALPGRLTQNRGPSTLGGDRLPRRAPSFFNWELPCTAELRQRFLQTLDQGLRWSLDGWVNVNRRGDGNRTHHHGNGPGAPKWSGIYYVDDGGGTAATIFLPGAIPGERRVFPEPGLLVIFPSIARHTVESHNGWRDRVTIAVNAYDISPVISGDRRPGVRSAGSGRRESNPGDSG